MIRYEMMKIIGDLVEPFRPPRFRWFINMLQKSAFWTSFCYHTIVGLVQFPKYSRQRKLVPSCMCISAYSCAFVAVLFVGHLFSVCKGRLCELKGLVYNCTCEAVTNVCYNSLKSEYHQCLGSISQSGRLATAENACMN